MMWYPKTILEVRALNRNSYRERNKKIIRRQRSSSQQQSVDQGVRNSDQSAGITELEYPVRHHDHTHDCAPYCTDYYITGEYRHHV